MTSILEMIVQKERQNASGPFATAKDKAALEKLEAEVKCLTADSPPVEDYSTSRYRIVPNIAALDAMISDLNTADVLAVKMMVTGPDVRKDKLIGIAICKNADYGYFVPLRRGDAGQLDTAAVFEKLKPLLETKGIIAHDAKIEVMWLSVNGVSISVDFDTQLAVQLLDESRPAGLNDSVVRLLDVADFQLYLEDPEVIATSVQDVGLYGIRTVTYVFRLYEKLLPIMKEGFDFVFSKVEVPAVPVTSALELAGMPIDVQYVEDAKAKARKQRDALEKKIHDVVGHVFEINSPAQLRTVLFDELKLPTTKKTKKGDASTSADALEEIDTATNPIVEMILTFRKYETVLKTLNGIEVDPATGRAYPTYAQADAVTGRMISGGGAFHAQGVPKDGTLPLSIRRAVGGEPGMKIVAADYKADELRLVAAQAQEGKLIEAFEAGVSPHGYTAKKLFSLKVAPDAVKAKHPDKYAVGKAVNFGIIFGKTPFGLARDLSKELDREVTIAEAEKIINDYFTEFPAVKTWVESTKQFARDHGFVVDLAGRKRRFVHIHRKAKKGDEEVARQRERELREAVNFCAQGLAASQAKRAMVRCHNTLKPLSPRAQLIAMRHDELLFLVPDDDIDKACAAIKAEMENDPELEARGMTVRPEVEITVGPTWADADQKPWPSASSAETQVTPPKKTTAVAGKKKSATKPTRPRKVK